MLCMKVLTLDGHTLDVQVDPAGCVKDIRRLLTEQYGLPKCALYLQARQLSMKTSMSELQLWGGACLTALTTLGKAVAAPAATRQQQQQQQQQAAVSPVSSPMAAATAAPPGQQQQQLDTLLPGYASRPNPSPIKVHPPRQRTAGAAVGSSARGFSQLLSGFNESAAAAAAAAGSGGGLQPSPSDYRVSAAAAQDINEAAAAAAGLSGGGFVLTGAEQQQSVYHGGSSSDGGVQWGRFASYNSSRKSDGRTLLQQHIMMQHDVRQQQLMAAQQQQQQLGDDDVQQQQQQQPGEDTVVVEPAAKRTRLSTEGNGDAQYTSAAAAGGGGGGGGVYIKLEQGPADLQQQQQQSVSSVQQEHQTQQQQQQQQQASVVTGLAQDPNTQQQQQQQPSMPYASWLHNAHSLSRSDQSTLTHLPLPAAVESLLLLHGRLDVCYTFLLQQRIAPRWGRLTDMMAQLFPQGPPLTLHHLMLMSQLLPQAVLLLQPPPGYQQLQQQYGVGDQIITLGDEIPWTAVLTDHEVQQLQQHLAAASSSSGDDADIGQQQRTAEDAAPQRAAAAATVEGSSVESWLRQLPAAAAAACGSSSGSDIDVNALTVVLVDPGPQRKHTRAAAGNRQQRRNSKSTGKSKPKKKSPAAAATPDSDHGGDTDDHDVESSDDAVAGVRKADDDQHAAGDDHDDHTDNDVDDNDKEKSDDEGLAAAAAAEGMTNSNRTIRRGRGAKTAAAPQQQQQQQGNVVSVSLSARFGSGSKVASARRQRHVRMCAAAAVAMVHHSFVCNRQQQQQQQQQQHDVKQSAKQDDTPELHRTGQLLQQQQQQQADTSAGRAAKLITAAAAGSTTGMTGKKRGRKGLQQQQQQGVQQEQTDVSDPQKGSDAAAAAAAAQPRRSRRRKTQQQQQQQGQQQADAPDAVHHVTHSKDVDENKGADENDDKDDSSSVWDPLQHHTWHPDFNIQQVTLQECLDAVAQHQHWTKQQQQQVDNHPTAATGGVKSAAAGVGVLSRPTRVFARHSSSCHSCQVLNPEQFLDHLKTLTWYQEQVVYVHHTAARAARTSSTTQPLSAPTLTALAARGVQQLFSHQAAAVDALMRSNSYNSHDNSQQQQQQQQQRVPRHVVVATSTASGKSLCYMIPVLEALARDAQSCSLFLFPTKALAQDQLRVLRRLVTDAFGQQAPHVEVYDGDTPQIARAEIRDRAQLLITNPDMLHQSILPCHKNFDRLLTNLKYVVVDEGHAYRGVFGCHTSLVLRRLRRVCCRCYDSDPQFVVTSATIANPLEHASLLLGVGVDELLLVDEDGSPHGPKQFVLWNPPLTWEAQQEIKQQQQQQQQQTAAAGGSAAAAAGSSSATRGLTRTEVRGGGHKLKREMARALARESNAARRRGTALSAAGGVSEQEWTAAVRLGAAGGAAKSLLFGSHNNSSLHSTSIAVDAAASAAADDDDGGEQSTAGAGQGTTSQQEQQQQQQQQQRGVRPGGARALYAASRSVAQEALAAVAAAAVVAPQPGGRRHQGHQQPAQSATLKPLVRPPSQLLQALGSAAANTPAENNNNNNNNNSSSNRVNSTAAARARARDGNSNSLSSRLSAQVQHEIEEALPARGSFKEKYGAAGTPLDQRRDSPIVEMSLLLTEAVLHGLQTIAFCKSRKLCELVTAYTRENIKAVAPHKAGMVKVYRGGYSPSERRQLESDLHTGALTAVAATNALELGIDVGQLDLTLHLGFPGSVASLWQQAGRAGRRMQPSLSVYVAFDGPLDQHFMRHPQQLFGRPIECVQLDPSNSLVLNSHLVCAAKEVPLVPELDDRLFGSSQLAAAMHTLTAAALLGRHPRDPPTVAALHYVGNVGNNPAAEISLRTIDPERFIIYNTADDSVLEEIEANMAFYEIYDGAIYLFQGHTFICTSLNLETRVAYVKPVSVRWYTKVRDYTDIHVTGGHVAYPTAHAALAAIQARRALAGQTDTAAAAAGAGAGGGGVVKPEAVKLEDDVKVEEIKVEAAAAGSSADCDSLCVSSKAICESCVITVRYMGYFRVQQGTGKVFDAIDLFLPDTQFETQASYLRLPPSARRACQSADIPFREAVHAASHALLNVLPLYMVCNSTDMGTECDHPYDTRFRPERLLLYDKHPGGIGLAAQATPLFPELLQRALDLVEQCSCPYTKGCPGCVQHLDCKNYNAVLNKAGAVLVLKAALEMMQQTTVEQQQGSMLAMEDS